MPATPSSKQPSVTSEIALRALRTTAPTVEDLALRLDQLACTEPHLAAALEEEVVLAVGRATRYAREMSPKAVSALELEVRFAFLVACDALQAAHEADVNHRQAELLAAAAQRESAN